MWPFKRRREIKSSAERRRKLRADSIQVPREILWLADSPMFIDTPQVEAFYDAIIRPPLVAEGISLAGSVTDSSEIAGGVTIGSAFPWVKAGVETSTSRSKQRTTSNQITLKPVHTAQRQLILLAFHYLRPPRNRIRMVTFDRACGDFRSTPEEPPWNEPEFILQVPRALMFMDLPDDTRFIPAALETTSGKVISLYDRLAEQIAHPGESPPPYPGSSAELRAERNAYWSWFDERYNDTAAMETVESAVDEDRIQWIDYRAGIGKGRTFLHLHVSGRGQYDTGTFAYKLVKRGSKHGLRLVGTLKSEPDMNVLAIFEK